MKRKSIMLVAGEASGDWLAAELVRALREEITDAEAVPTWDYQPLHASLEPHFFGAGGAHMASAGVELAFDLTAHSVMGLWEPIKNLAKFRRFLLQLRELAVKKEPDAIIFVDFSGFNLRLAHAIKTRVRMHLDWFHDWNPKLIQFVSPQVWASRAGRANQLAQDHNLLLSIFPFEKEWYARRVPELKVEFVGHPMLDRYSGIDCHRPLDAQVNNRPTVLLLPGSRPSELARHIPVINGAMARLRENLPELHARLVLPSQERLNQAKAMELDRGIELQIGDLPQALKLADVALACSGTVTMECALCGVPAVVFYKTSWFNYEVAKRIATVEFLAMPNLLAKEPIFPEFIQDAATAENVANAALELLRDEPRRQRIRIKLAEIISSLGGPGASRRAAKAVVRLFEPRLSEPPVPAASV
jgi:lipid-A-disaccharide synthase